MGLLFGSLPGPGLTLGAPVALAFALYDRRLWLRIVALVLLAGLALTALGLPGGPAPLAMAAGATGWSAAAVARGERGSLQGLAVPALAGAGAGWLAAAVALPQATAAWEAALGRAVLEGGEAALVRYQALGMSGETLAVFEQAIAAAGTWIVRLWPALTALALWLGAWLAGRLLARWGRTPPEIAERVTGRFAEFAAGMPAVWLLIAAMIGLWIPGGETKRVAANVGLAGLTLLILDGLAVVAWWLERRGVRRLLAAALGVLAIVFALPLTALALLALGLADSWIRFRDRAGESVAAGPWQR